MHKKAKSNLPRVWMYPLWLLLAVEVLQRKPVIEFDQEDIVEKSCCKKSRCRLGSVK